MIVVNLSACVSIHYPPYTQYHNKKATTYYVCARAHACYAPDFSLLFLIFSHLGLL